MKLYFDRLFYFVENNARRDEFGNWIPPREEGQWIDKGDCRIELQLEGSSMKGNDKQYLNVSSVIYAPLSLDELPKQGQRIKVIDSTGEERLINCINASRGLLHVRIWAE